MNFSDLFAKDSVLTNLANSYATGLANSGKKPKPLIIQQAAPVPSVPTSIESNPNKMLYIGGGVAAFVLILVLVMKGRK